jgi:hypothetical protein
MYRRAQTDSGNSTIMTSSAMGPSQAVDVDEWLYQATRVRAFAQAPPDYVPRHRAAS